MKELIEQIGRERLEQLADDNTICVVSWDERTAMARALLAVMDAQSEPDLVLRPFGYDGKTFVKTEINHDAAVCYYTIPPAASEPVSQSYTLATAVNTLLDCDGSRGTFSAIRRGDALKEVERILAAAPGGLE